MSKFSGSPRNENLRIGFNTRMNFDVERAWLQGPDMFQRFNVVSDRRSLSRARLPDDERLLLFERNGERRALLTRQMVYHHVAQGELAGKPYLVTF